MKRQLHLNLFIHSRGHHEASWRHPDSSPLPLTDIRYYQDLAQRAEAALFDSIFLADQLALGDDVAQAARTWLEPITVLAALAVATSRIGLIATARPPTPSRSTWRGSSPRSITSATGAPAGTSSPRGWRRRRATSAAPARSATPTAMPAARNSWPWSRRCGTAGPRTRCSTTAPADATRGRTASGRSTTAASFTRSPGRSTCRAVRRAGRCWCRRARPTPAAASRRGMPRRCSPRIWKRRRRRHSTPI